MDNQLVVDLRRWARGAQINVIIRHLMKDPPPNAVRKPEVFVRPKSFEEDLERHYAITYRAPFDAGDTKLPDGSIDLISTTSVWEHIPRAQIPRLLRECARLCHAGSIMSHAIDYTDHYAHSDPSITRYNFLQFTPEQWERYNPDIHYQNRLRHSDYRDMFEDAGFDVVEEHVWMPEDSERQSAKIKLAEDFVMYDRNNLLSWSGHFVLRKP
jgi:predicted SAM-dependent methyltransferase